MAPRPGLPLLASVRLVEHPPCWKKVPLKDVRTYPFVFLLMVEAFGSGVGHLVRNTARNWLFFFFLTPYLKPKPWQIWLPPFSTLSLIWNKVRQVANVHSLYCVLWLTRDFQGYSIDATYLTAFRCKNISAHLLLAQNLLCVFYFTEHFKWRLSLFFLAHYALPRTPCSSWF